MSLNCGSLDPIQSLTLKQLTMCGNIYPDAPGTRYIGSSTKGFLRIFSYAIQSPTDLELTGTAGKNIILNKSPLTDLKVFTTAPALADMAIGEIALGNGTGGGGENEWFIKVSATHIARFVRDSDITT